MGPEEQERLVDALAFALAHHGGQTRKGSSVPYAAHLLQVAGSVLEHGGSTDQAAAALLHDVVEDTTVELDDVAVRFGDGIATIVADCTDTLPGDTPERKSPWRERKERGLAKLAQAGPEAALVAACDKRHNLAGLVDDVARRGVGSIEPPRFSSRPDEQLWYYGEAAELLRPKIPPDLADELDRLVVELKALLLEPVPASSADEVEPEQQPARAEVRVHEGADAERQ